MVDYSNSLLLIVVGIIMIFILWDYYKTYRQKSNASYLRKHGLTASAKLIQVKDTGVRVGDDLLLECELNVTNDVRPYRCTIKSIVPVFSLAKLQATREVRVKIDPKNLKNVVLDLTEWIESECDNEFMDDFDEN